MAEEQNKPLRLDTKEMEICELSDNGFRIILVNCNALQKNTNRQLNTFFSNSDRTLPRHKTSFTKFKIEIILSIFYKHNGMKLEVNKRTTGKFTNTLKLNNTLLNNQKCVKREITRKFRKY